MLTLNHLGHLPTLHSGHDSDLKIETPEIRIWQSRMTLADGETEPIQIEKLVDGRWTKFYGDVLLNAGGVMIAVYWVHRTYAGGFNSKVREREYSSRIYDWENPPAELWR